MFFYVIQRLFCIYVITGSSFRQTIKVVNLLVIISVFFINSHGCSMQFFAESLCAEKFSNFFNKL